MKTIFCVLLCLLTVILPALAATRPTRPANAKLRHVVSLRFKDTATKEQIRQIEEAFRALKKKIPQVSALEWGTNVSPEKLNKGFTHGFILTFRSEKERDDYLANPDHKEFGKLLGPVLADVFVTDFWARD